MKRKVLSVLLASAMVMSMAACGSDTTDAPASSAPAKSDAPAASSEAAPAASSEAAPEAYKLTEPIVAYVDGTVNYVKEDSGKEEFVSALNAHVSEKMGYDVTIEFTPLDHSSYADAAGRLFAGGEYPDVMIMSAGMFRQYQTTGILWDMSDAYENAEFQSRITKPVPNEGNYTKDGAMYGFTPAAGGGCPTYVKSAWLDAVGMKQEDIKDWNSFYNMLLAFHTGDPDGNGVNGDTYGFVSAGLLSNEAPYINYLPEFWQDAYPALVEKDGKWIDGFQTDATKQALLRLQQAYKDGAIDPESYTFGTKQAREKYWSNDQTGSAGAFCYWSGSWCENIYNNLVKNEVKTDLLQLDPIAEVAAVGGYLNREAPVWVIIDDGDGSNEREQAIFDAFIEPMLDGGDGQTLWIYGVKGIHWDTKAESITTGAGDKAKTTEYKEGEFHLLPTIADPTALFKKNHFDTLGAVAPLENGYDSTTDMQATSNLHFNQHCYQAPAAASSETFTNESGNIHDAKMEVISDVVVKGGDVDAAMAKYVQKVGAAVEACLTEMNAN